MLDSGSAPTGAWAGQAGVLAAWTDGGWRFVAPPAGMTAWLAAAGVYARFDGTAWRTGELVADRIVIGGDQVVGDAPAGDRIARRGCDN